MIVTLVANARTIRFVFVIPQATTSGGSTPQGVRCFYNIFVQYRAWNSTEVYRLFRAGRATITAL